ncbi:hypothetical protein, partial [Paraglaciecola sp.]
YRFQHGLHESDLISLKSRDQIFNSESPYSWNINKFKIGADKKVTMHSYEGKFDGYSAMITRFVEDKYAIIILSNTGTSYQLKQQLTSDITSVLYGQPAPDLSKDKVIFLVNSLVEGRFDNAMAKLELDNGLEPIDEQTLTALAYEILWSALADESLQLFSFLYAEFEASSAAKENIGMACNHRLAINAQKKSLFCQGN